MICRKCGEDLDNPTVGFKAVCPVCSAWLHTCTQCSLFNQTADRCRSMTTEAVRDRDGLNYCEEFSPAVSDGNPSSPASDNPASDRFDRLFGGGPD